MERNCGRASNEAVTQVTDLSPDPGREIHSVTAHHDHLYFHLKSEASELWMSDGTPEGTSLLASFVDSRVEHLTATDTGLYFLTRSDDGEKNARLWRSDGTAEGTLDVTATLDVPVFSPNTVLPASDGVLLSNSITGDVWAYSSNPDRIEFIGNVPVFRHAEVVSTWLDDHQFLLGETALWQTDGTEAGTVQVTDVGAGDKYQPEIAELQGKLYFSGLGGEGAELWQSDGTAAGTKLVVDIYPGLAPDGEDTDGETELGSVGEDVFFFFHRSFGISNGTAEGTSILLDRGGSELVDFQGNAVFVSGSELWQSDGTTAGTNAIHRFPEDELNALFRFPRPRELTVLGDQILFTVDHHELGRELWVTDGTSQGTALVKDISESTGSAPSELTAFDGHVFFRANGQQLWRTDGTLAGTTLVRAFSSTADDEFAMTVLSDRLFFFADDGSSGRELWQSDGTPEGTNLVVADLSQDEAGSIVSDSELVASADRIFFTAVTDSDATQLWASDGSPGGTILIYDSEDTLEVHDLTVLGGQLFFTAESTRDGRELWVTDGTTSGTRQVKDIRAGAASSYPLHLLGFDGKLYFTANDGQSGRELWQSDGTPGGTQQVSDTWPGSESSDPADLTVAGNRLFFTANDGIHDRELWSIDVTPTPSADFDANGIVDFVDFLTLANHFGEDDAIRDRGDANGDQLVDFADFLILAEQFGRAQTPDNAAPPRSARREGFA